MRIIFFGATELGYRCCQELIGAGETVAGIITLPRQFQISYLPTPVTNVTYCDFEELAAPHHIPMLRVTASLSTPEYLATLADWRPDFGLVIGWYHLVPRQVRDLFPLGVAGIHASLLPQYRGGAPLVWAIIKGEPQTGVTLFYLDDGVDTGDIISQTAFPIGPTETIRHVYDHATTAAVDLVRRNIPLIRQRQAPRLPQDHSRATQFPQRQPADGLIDWSKSPTEIHNFIRAQTRPYPGAFTYIEGKKVTVWDASVEATPGTSAP